MKNFSSQRERFVQGLTSRGLIVSRSVSTHLLPSSILSPLLFIAFTAKFFWSVPIRNTRAVACTVHMRHRSDEFLAENHFPNQCVFSHISIITHRTYTNSATKNTTTNTTTQIAHLHRRFNALRMKSLSFNSCSDAVRVRITDPSSTPIPRIGSLSIRRIVSLP